MKIVWGRSIGWNIDYNRARNKVYSMGYSTITDGPDCVPWTEFFAIIPRRTINGKLVWFERAYWRKIWIVWGHSFHMEPENQYATIFDILAERDDTNN